MDIFIIIIINSCKKYILIIQKFYNIFSAIKRIKNKNFKNMIILYILLYY